MSKPRKPDWLDAGNGIDLAGNGVLTFDCRPTVVATLVVLVAGGTKPAWAQFEQLMVEASRPLYKIAGLIEDRCACVITYEDPPYSMAQVVNWATTVRRDGKSTRPLWVPPRAFFSFQYDLAAASHGRAEIARNASFAIAQFNVSRKDGVAFRLADTDNMFHVVPESGSILDTVVAPSITQGSREEVIRSIVEALVQARGVQIYVNSRGPKHAVRLNASSGTARRLLASTIEGASTIAGVPVVLSWKLLYQPEYGYVLNIVNLAVPAERRQ